MRSPRETEIAATMDAATSDAATMEAEGATAPVRAGAVTTEEPGRYTTEAELGRGGMGRVVVARDRHLDRDVAMKLLLGSSDAGASLHGVARFVREARVTGGLEHPGIVPVHELGRRDDGTLYYTMKRIRGRSLAAVLQAKN